MLLSPGQMLLTNYNTFLARCYANKICVGPDVAGQIGYQGVTLQMLLVMFIDVANLF